MEDPIGLALVLSFSVFHYEVLSSPDEACQTARTAFEDAGAKLDIVAEDSYSYTLIVRLLRENRPHGHPPTHPLSNGTHEGKWPAASPGHMGDPRALPAVG